MRTHGVIYRFEHIASGRSYVGQTTHFVRRLASHLKAKSLLGRALRKYGLAAFRVETLEVEHVDNLDRAEADWIALFDCIAPNGFNLTTGGASGRQHHPSTRAKIAAAHIGRPHSDEHRANIAQAQIGRVVSPETRAKIGAANRGRVRSAEARARTVAALRGREVSSETRAKMSASNRGQKRSPETCARISAAKRKGG